MTTYLANGFSPSMLMNMPLDVEFRDITKEEFCEEVVKGRHENAIGHVGTVELINSLCGSRLKVNRITMSVNVGDEIYITMLTVRLEEGKILSKEEITKMYEEGKVKFVKAKVYGDVLNELAACEGICEEKTYDYLAHKAQFG